MVQNLLSTGFMHTNARPLLSALLGIVIVFAATTNVAMADPPRPQSLYRFDVTILDAGAPTPAMPATYSLVLAENSSGRLTVGTSVPVATTAAATAPAREDIGVDLRLGYAMRGEVVVLSGTVELSSLEPGAGARTVRRIRVDGFARITDGTPSVFASVVDPASHRRYEITIVGHRVL